MSVPGNSPSPKAAVPQYDADQDHDGLAPGDRGNSWTVHAEPEEPDSDPQGGSGKVDFESKRPADADGGDAPSGDMT